MYSDSDSDSDSVSSGGSELEIDIGLYKPDLTSEDAVVARKAINFLCEPGSSLYCKIYHTTASFLVLFHVSCSE
jgi:hypothetical protein